MVKHAHMLRTRRARPGDGGKREEGEEGGAPTDGGQKRRNAGAQERNTAKNDVGWRTQGDGGMAGETVPGLEQKA